MKVEVAYCGVCGTDIHVLHDTFRNYPPVILGHEFAGTVIEVGRNVAGVSQGARIAAWAPRQSLAANANTAALGISYSTQSGAGWGMA
ncbi:MAG: alcohol dehydrogenase catalytic domain-containing protein [Bryobacteraceae bacterium]